MNKRCCALLFLCLAAEIVPLSVQAQPVQLSQETSVAPPRSDIGNGVCVSTVHVRDPASGQVPFSSVDDALAVLNGNSQRLVEDGRMMTAQSLINFRNNDPLALGDFYGASLFSFSANPGAEPQGNDRNFAVRVRGYLNVNTTDPAQLLRTIGVYADDGARLTIGGTPVMVPDVDQRFLARRIAQVQYGGAGLYPFELDYYQNGSLAVLELSESQQQIPQSTTLINLADAGFKLIGEPQANLFANTELYTSRSPGAPLCIECDTDAACPSGNYCVNDFGPVPPRGLCQQCTAADHCGADCSPCGGATPLCAAGACVQCLVDTDCPTANRCDPVIHSCQALPPDWRYLGGCSAAPPSSATGSRGPRGVAWLVAGAALLALLLLRRSRRGRPAAGLWVAVLGLAASWPAAARAELSANVVTFQPAIGPDSIITVEGTRSDRRLRPFFNVLFEYAHRPLRLVDFNSGLQIAETVPDLMTLHVMGGMGITHWLSLAADLPVVVYQSFDRATPTSDVPIQPSSYGVGDMRLLAKMRIINNERGGFGLAFVPQFTFPTGDATQLRSDDAYGIEPRLALDYRTSSGALIAVNAGFLGKTSNQVLRGMEVGSQIRYGVGAFLPLPAGFGLLGELAGGTSVSSVPGGMLYSPLEAHTGLRYVHSSGLNLSVGGGAGITPAVGSPQYRMFASIGFLPVERKQAPPPPPPRTSAPPVRQQPLPPPPPLAPPPPKAQFSNLLVEKTGDGTGTVFSEPGGIACGKLCVASYLKDQEVRLTAMPAQDSRFAGWEGPCSGLEPCTVLVRNEPRVRAHFIKRQVVVTDTKLDLQGNVIHFETGKARIMLDSFHLLDEVVLILKTHPNMNLRIEGHADSVIFYAPGGNLKLSKDRAAAVVWYLIDHGIAGGRLSSEGFGDTCPVATNWTAEGRTANRRTEFLLVDPQTGRYERTPCVAYTAAPKFQPRRSANFQYRQNR